MTKLSFDHVNPAAGNPPVEATTTSPDSESLAVVGPVPSQQEIEWKKSLKNLESAIEEYKHSRGRPPHDAPIRGGSLGTPEKTAEGVAEAMEHVAESHPDPEVKDHWKKKAKAFRTAREDERDGILEDIGKGLLILLTTPFMLVGAVLGVVGGILDGVGKILRGIGRFSRQLSYTGSPKGGAEHP